VGRWDLFQKAARQILHSLWNAPDPEPASTGKAGKKGCPVLNFRVSLPFHGMEARLCGLLKEIPTALIFLFQNAKLIRFQ